MATVAASYFVSHLNGGRASLDSKTNLAQIGLRNTPLTHDRLRTINNIDMLKNKSSIKSDAKKGTVNKTKRFRAPGQIICGEGMTLCIVSAECGPWSKTGGLGDVLAGLPPALAVSFYFLC